MIKVAVAWHNPEQLDRFLTAWGTNAVDPLLVLQQDVTREGGSATKNKALHRAMEMGAEIVVSLDDDCFPSTEATTLEKLCCLHREALEPQPVAAYCVITDPPSRGTPYFCRTRTVPVAASLGFWLGVGDYDAPGQLVHGSTHPMIFHRKALMNEYFPLCGMNIAFRPREWHPWWVFQPHGRFDDIFQGYLWQRAAYDLGHCFNLAGPLVTHSRQSDVFANLRTESRHMEANETVWKAIAESPSGEYEDLVKLLPPP